MNSLEYDTRLPHVLLIYREMLPSIILCGHSQLSYLNEIGEVEYRSCQEMQLNEDDLAWADIVFLGRLDSWYEKKNCQMLHMNGKHLVYIIDDDLLEVPKDISSAPYYRLPEIRACISEIMNMCQAIITPSPRLIEKYALGGREGILIDEPVIHHCTYKPHALSNSIRIGFAGTIDRTHDVENILGEALLRLHAEYGDAVNIFFFGAIPDFAGRLNAQTVPFCMNYSEYLRQLEKLELDIGLGPMPADDFHSKKHYIKYIEYSSMGMVSVLSDVEPYSRLRDMGSPAVFCDNNSESWYRTIKTLVDNRDRLETLRYEAWSYARDRFKIEETAKPLAAYLDKVYAERPTSEITNVVPYRLTFKKRLNIIHKLILFVKRYGWNTPQMFARKVSDRILKKHE